MVSVRRPAFSVLCFALVAAVLLFSDKGRIDGDAAARFQALEAVVERGELTAERYSIVQPLLAIPLYLAGSGLASLRGVAPDDLAGRRETIRQVVGRFGKVVAFAVAAWLFAQLRRRYGFSDAEAGGATLLLLFGSLLIPHAVDFYAEPLWTLLCLVALGALADEAGEPYEAAVRRRGLRRSLLVTCVALSVPLSPVLAPVLAGAGLAASLLSRPRRAAPFLLAAGGAAAGVALALAENALRRGGPLDFGYAGEGFTTPLLHGLAGMLFSPARGLLFFAPALVLLPLAARRGGVRGADPLLTLGAVFTHLLVLAYAKWHAWHGATYWGPRFLLPASVLAVLALAVVAKREGARWGPAAKAGLVVLAAVSYAVYKSGAAIRMKRLLPCVLDRGGDYESCFWLWSQHPLASWLDLPGLRDLLTHRSTAVELGALLLFALLVAATRRGSASGYPPERPAAGAR